MDEYYIILSNIEMKLKAIADRHVDADDDEFNSFDYSGGNFDDAYSLGSDSGEVFLARSLLKEFFNA